MKFFLQNVLLIKWILPDSRALFLSYLLQQAQSMMMAAKEADIACLVTSCQPLEINRERGDE